VNENRNCYRKEEVKQLWVLKSHQSAKLNYLLEIVYFLN
jgi:hypothetical protein